MPADPTEVLYAGLARMEAYLDRCAEIVHDHQLGGVGERPARELHGITCLPLKEVSDLQKSLGAAHFLEVTSWILSLFQFASDSRPVHQRLFEYFLACHGLRFEDGFQR